MDPRMKNLTHHALVAFSSLTLVVSAASAFAGMFFDYTRWPAYPVCGYGVSYDSFGRGIEDGFKSTSLRARQLDETCYNWGVLEGKKTREANTWSFCTTAFDRGRADGYRIDSNDPADTCYAQGYKAGEAALDIDAREGNAPSECQTEYNRGRQEARDGVSPSEPGDSVPNHCYDLGRYDGSAGL